MSTLDWTVLSCTLLAIVLYGVYKSMGAKNMEGFLMGNRDSKWWTIGLSVMATQASAITFLSTPGQAYADGMKFVQFYFGLPIAMVLLCIFFLPIYFKLRVYTAYEYLEGRFDLKTRSLTAVLFLIQRGLGAGITIYAPAIILSSILGWNLNITNLIIGTAVIIYTVSGGTKAVSITQKWQMGIIFLGMFLAFGYLIYHLPAGYSFSDALKVAGATGKMQVIDTSFDWNSRYTLWTGLIGGLFVQLAYFGTDQSQVQRYLSGQSLSQSRYGLLMNGLLKVPMQFFILLVGIMVFVFYQNSRAPLFFNSVGIEAVANSTSSDTYNELENEFTTLYQERQILNRNYLDNWNSPDNRTNIQEQIKANELAQENVRNEAKAIISSVDSDIETNDRDYVFIHFILNHLPKGLIGLLLAVILSAAMSSTAAELNALSNTTTIDIYKRSINAEASDGHYVGMTKLFTVLWGLIAIAFACFGTLFENLIQFVNIVGSLFYGTILGVFLVGFFFKSIKGHAVFIAAIISETVVLTLFKTTEIGYLWYNLIGCGLVVLIGFIVQSITRQR